MNKGDPDSGNTQPAAGRAGTPTPSNSSLPSRQSLEEILARSRVQPQAAASKKTRVIEQEYDESTKRQQIQLEKLLRADQPTETDGKEVNRE